MGLYDWLGQGDDEDQPFNVTKAAYNVGSPLYGMLHQEETPPLDPADERVQQYTAHAQQPMPSQGMYEKFIGSRPEFDDYKKGGFWRNLGAGLLSLGGSQGVQAARQLLHPGFNKAYGDWETQGKYLPAQARAADEGRKQELASEKFNIVGDAKRKQAELAKIKADADAKAKDAKAQLDAHKQELKEAADKKADERREAAAIRAENAANRAEEREARAERESKAREQTTKNREVNTLRNRREDALAKEVPDIENEVLDSVTSNPEFSKYFTKDKKGNVVYTEEGEAAGIRDYIKGEIEKKKHVRSITAFGE